MLPAQEPHTQDGLSQLSSTPQAFGQRRSNLAASTMRTQGSSGKSAQQQQLSAPQVLQAQAVLPQQHCHHSNTGVCSSFCT